MNRKFIGSFIYRNLGNGILSGTFMNNRSNGVCPENCKLRDSSTLSNDFVGDYDSTWIEGVGEFHNSQLVIEADGQTGGYNLTWISDGMIIWVGYGMRAGDLLVGGYC